MNHQADSKELLINLQKSEDNTKDELFDSVYNELKQLAYTKIQREYGEITISKTGLVHEVYLKMNDKTKIHAKDKSHFLEIASRCMRQILVDCARKKKAKKRGGSQKDKTYIDELFKVYERTDEMINLDNKLNELSQLNERMADIVTLRFFGQMTVHSTAEALGVSERTVKRDWAKARGWLYKELKGKFSK